MFILASRINDKLQTDTNMCSVIDEGTGHGVDGGSGPGHGGGRHGSGHGDGRGGRGRHAVDPGVDAFKKLEAEADGGGNPGVGGHNVLGKVL